MVLASHTVQVTSDAKASPISTAFTTGSALMYMPHGLRSRGSVAVPMTGVSPASCASANAGTPIHAIAATPRASAQRIQLLQNRISTGLIPRTPLTDTDDHDVIM